MGKHSHDKQPQTFFLKSELVHRIIRLTKFPALMLTISGSALLLIFAFNHMPSFFTFTIPDHECTFFNLSLDEQLQVQHLVEEKSKKVSFFYGVQKLGNELLKEIPTLGRVSCSLDRDKKLHVLATGKEPQHAKGTSTIIAARSPKQPINHHEAKPIVSAKTTPQETPFNHLLSTQDKTIHHQALNQSNQKPPASVLLSQTPPSFNPEIVVSGKRN